MSGSAKVALITGSTSGIGLATAHALAKNGVDVIVTGFGDEATITRIVNEIKTRYGVNVNYVAADLSRESDIDSLWSAVVDIYPNGVDILVNNAGFYHRRPVESFPVEDWNQTMAVMLTAPFHLTKLCVPAMKKKGYGRIVNMSSIMGLCGARYISAYCTVKHGIIGLTKDLNGQIEPAFDDKDLNSPEEYATHWSAQQQHLTRLKESLSGVALETAAHGITCNAVCPAFVETPLKENIIKTINDQDGVSTEDVQKRILSTNASGKLVSPEQVIRKISKIKCLPVRWVAELVEFLCLSNASSQMTGAAYLIDYGFTAQ